MNVQEAIEGRRSYRSLAPVEITDEMVEELARSAGLAASCFNKQPWRYIFVRDPAVLKEMHSALKPGNEWAQNASMMIVICPKEEDDCIIRERVYYLFDTGMATQNLILRATDMGLVAHPIAGFSPTRTREVLGIPEDVMPLVVLIVGKKADEMVPELSEKQVESEKERPARKSVEEFASFDKY